MAMVSRAGVEIVGIYVVILYFMAGNDFSNGSGIFLHLTVAILDEFNKECYSLAINSSSNIA